jgi:hypothetical protein
MGNAFPHREATPYSFVKLGPALHEMMVVLDDVTKILWRVFGKEYSCESG